MNDSELGPLRSLLQLSSMSLGQQLLVDFVSMGSLHLLLFVSLSGGDCIQVRWGMQRLPGNWHFTKRPLFSSTSFILWIQIGFH